jgi:hypothetical protein
LVLVPLPLADCGTANDKTGAVVPDAFCGFWTMALIVGVLFFNPLVCGVD